MYGLNRLRKKALYLMKYLKSVPQGLNSLRKNSLPGQFAKALCQGTTSVVPQIAENKGGLQPLRDVFCNFQPRSRVFPQPVKPVPFKLSH